MGCTSVYSILVAIDASVGFVECLFKRVLLLYFRKDHDDDDANQNTLSSL
jgi:hypothetical protein